MRCLLDDIEDRLGEGFISERKSYTISEYLLAEVVLIWMLVGEGTFRVDSGHFRIVVKKVILLKWV